MIPNILDPMQCDTEHFGSYAMRVNSNCSTITYKAQCMYCLDSEKAIYHISLFDKHREMHLDVYGGENW